MKEAGSDIVVDAIFPPPRICITLAAYQKLSAYVAACPMEVSGLGLVTRVGNDFLITDAFVLKQTVTPASAEIDDDALHHIIHQVVRAGRSPKELMFQWHSHADMSAYCSPKDLQLIAAYQCDAMISLVMNKRGKYHCRLDLYQPVRIGFVTRLLVVLPPPDAEMVEQCQRDIARDVVMHPSLLERMGRFVRSLHGNPTAFHPPPPVIRVDADEVIIPDTPPPSPAEGQP